jgi:hypothetical protein
MGTVAKRASRDSTEFGTDLLYDASGTLFLPMIAQQKIIMQEIAVGYLSVSLGCKQPGCTELAARVELIAKGVPHLDDEHLLRKLLESGDAAGQIILYGFLLYGSHPLNTSRPLSPGTYASIEMALRRRDVSLLYETNEEYAPFYCFRCRAVYCARHFQLQEVWDEAGLDYWTGTCPQEHGLFIDH